MCVTGQHIRRHLRPTKLAKNLLYYGGVDTRYRVASNVMHAYRRRGEPSPKMSNILKKMRILQDEGFYETVGHRKGLPIIKPSLKFHLFAVVDDLKKFERNLKHGCEELEKVIAEIENLVHGS